MYKKIIVSLALDHGIAQSAISAARKLLDDGGEILAVHVYEKIHSSTHAFVTSGALATALENVKERLAERAAEHADIKTVLLEGHSGRTITDYAETSGADCIIVGSHKPGLQDYFLGSTASRVVRHAPCSVHVLR